MSGTRKPKVLVADDEVHLQYMLKALLETMGCEVAAMASTGEEAWEAWKRLAPDMTFLDINMPGGDGVAVLERIMATNAAAFVVMLTSVVDAASVERCVRAGAAGYIRKDTPVAEMKKLMLGFWNEHLRQQGGEA
jgi:CheY-like chemotaxis protein